MSGSGARKRDTPDNGDFAGAPQESGQQPEEAPPEVAGPGGRDEKRGERERSEDKGRGEGNRREGKDDS
jgi:hypothetical protein